MSHEITKLHKDLLKESTTKQITSLRDKISNMQKFSSKVLLVDTSGSMATFLANTNDGNLRRIDIVNNVLENFQGARLFEFNSSLFEVTKLGMPRGGTNLANAFLGIAQRNIKEIILLTDGEPDSQERALNAAKETRLKINIVYIGNPPVPDFLKHLAALAGGIFDVCELISKETEGLLENKIRLLLNA